jgi:hypothetical protein
MTSLHLPDTISARVPRRPSVGARVSGLALAFGLVAPAAPALAQVPANPPPPPRPAVQAPAQVPPPLSATPPRAGGPALRTAAVPAPAAAKPAPHPAPAQPGVSLDSIRRKPSTASLTAPPANAVALCKDGTYIVSPGAASACASHRGLQAVLPRRTAPPAPSAAAAAVTAPAAVRSVAPAPTAPPAGATMGCKDGTFLGGTPNASACAGHRGLAVVLPAPRTPPPPPAHVTSPRRPAPRGAVQAPTAPVPARPTTARPAAVRPAPAKSKPNPPNQP